MLCSATARLSESQRFAVRPCQTRGKLRKGDPPRGPLRSDDVCGVRVPDRGGRVGLRSSFDGGDGRVAGSRNGLRPSSADCSRRGRDRSACRSRTRSDSEGISRVSASPAAHPRPALCPNEATTDDVPESRKTCDNPGRSSFCLRERGLVHSRIRSVYSGSSLASGHGRAVASPHAHDVASAGDPRLEGQSEDRREALRPDLRSSTGRSPLGQRPLGQEDPNLNLEEPAASPRGEMFRFLRFYVRVYKSGLAGGL